MVSRRSFLAASVSAIAAPALKSASIAGIPRVGTTMLAADLIRRSTVIDMLGLLTLNYRKLTGWESMPERFSPADFKRLKDSGINIFHPAVGFVEGDVYSSSLRDITGWNLLIAAYPKDFLRIDGPGDLDAAKRSGRIGIIIGQQNSEHFRSVDDVDRFYRLGQRVSQLTYRDNRIGGGSTDARNLGLTEYGGQIVQRMNQVGMAIDVSHCSDRTTLDAIEASQKPVLVTHANCRALVPGSARCRTDEAIRKLAAKGGVMGVTMVRPFVAPAAAAQVTVDNVLDHIDHVAQIAGIEHVGIGTDVDLDGRDGRNVPRHSDLDGVAYSRKIYELTEGLLRRGYSQPDIELILGGNFERALTEIWTV